jgi:hypothetical protein
MQTTIDVTSPAQPDGRLILLTYVSPLTLSRRSPACVPSACAFVLRLIDLGAGRYGRRKVTIEHEMVLYDPEFYTEPYVAQTRYFRREPAERITYFGWYGLYSGVTDLMCAPMNVIERYREGAY